MAEHSDSEMTWQEQETLNALRRLANARSQLALLEEQAAQAATPPPVAADDVARVEALQAEAAELAHRAKARFGGGAARQRIAELEAEERLVLQRCGAADLAELRALAATPAAPVVDDAVLEFARRELAAAEAAWVEVQALELPDPEPDPVVEADDDAPLATVTEIDLRVKPQAAS